ncbi:MAG: double-cubane-cluster-containing anaerobic reductase [Nitrososphaerales archaeon]|jgi:benzoyl-CoA reductase/2-hydroxyglutaryl-CoA dehydratase subunit BcrC/BadD/HgdB
MSQEYRQMWSDLGLNLEKHDLLLGALGKIYGDLFMTQKSRPEKMKYFDFVISEVHGLRIKELQEKKKLGKKVIGAFCLYVPEELAYAADTTMVGLCGGADFSIPDAEAILPRNLCPLIKSFFGFKVGGTCPYFQSCDMVVGETTCDGKKKVYEILADYTPTYVMEIPHRNDTTQAKSLWLSEVKLFKERMESLTGHVIEKDALKDSIRLINAKRAALKRVALTRRASPVPISGLDALLVNQISFYDDVQRFTQMTNELADELETRVKNGVGVADKDKSRLMFSGCPMAIPNWKLHSIIESMGFPVVAEESCIGSRYFTDQVEPKGDSMDSLLEALVERYSKISCACFTPNTERIDKVVKMAKDFDASGVVYNVLQYCHTYNVEAIKVEKALKAANFPMLKIETDYGTEDVEQIKTRVEAFTEMLS